MKITNISEYLGGADNVLSYTMIRGEQHFRRFIVKSGGSVVNITNYNLSAKAKFFRSSITVGRRSISFNSLEVYEKDDLDLDWTVIDAEQGESNLLIPNDLLTSDEVGPINSNEDVSTVVIYLVISDGASTPHIDIPRMVIFVRPGV